MASCAVPAWYKSLGARPKPRRAARKNDAADDERIALEDKRAVLAGEIRAAAAERRKSEARLEAVAKITAGLWAHAGETVEHLRRVVAYRAKVIDRLTDEAIEASLTGDFTKSRKTMAHLDRVTDRQRVLGERVASDMESLRKAEFVRADHETRLEMTDKTRLLCAEMINRLGTWALP